MEAEGPGQKLAVSPWILSGFGRPHSRVQALVLQTWKRALAPPTELLLRSGFIVTRILDLVR